MISGTKDTIIQAIVIILVGTVIGFVFNAVNPSGIDVIGKWAVADSTGFKIPESYQEGDSLITLDEAIGYFQSKDNLFIDARYPEDFAAGHIEGAINLPFESDQLDLYFDRLRDRIVNKKNIIVYCSETDCDLSLFLARYLKSKDERIKTALVFVQGWESWTRAGMPISTGKQN